MSECSASLGTIIVLTTRLRELAKFYRVGLDLPDPIAYGGHHLGFTVGPIYLGFDQVKPSAARREGPIALWFTVDDIDAVFQRFVSMGAGIGYPPTLKPWGDTLASLLDPDGNVLGLAQRRTAGRRATGPTSVSIGKTTFDDATGLTDNHER